ncbi:MAG: fumarylacetoacetate hydrolase family protein [Betaproteobacteria bacterium]
MSDDRSTQAAHYLLAAHREHAQFDALPDAFSPRDVEDAYAIQDAFSVLRIPMLGPIAGHKVALTSLVMQKMVGFSSPFAGPIHAGIIYRGSATLASSDYGRLGIECELAASLGADLPVANAPYTREQIAAAVDTLSPAFELVDDRNADYTKISSLILTLIADNAWNGGIVLGEPVRDWRALDLASIRGELCINGEVAGEGYGRDVLGHPFDALAWLANTLAERGTSLSKGMVVMTGSMIATKFVAVGDRVSLSVEGLGEVEVNVA